MQIGLTCLLSSPTPASIHHPNNDNRTVKRLLGHIKIIDNCWIWTQHLNWNGYAITRYKNKKWRAHRLSYVLIGKKSLTPGMVLDHLCRHRNCINPKHLEQVTLDENLIRSNGFGYTLKLESQQSRQKYCKFISTIKLEPLKSYS